MAPEPAEGSNSQELWNDIRDRWQRAWAALHSDPPVVLYHYTTAQGLEGIIKSQKFHASHVSYLNDATELVYARSVIQDVLRHQATIVKSGVTRQFVDNWQRLLASAVTESEVYVACFCTEEDLLSQWRGYAGSTGGYAMGLYTPSWLEKVQPTVVLRKIIYKRNEQEDWIESLFRPVLERLDGLSNQIGDEAAGTYLPGLLRLCQEEISECLFCLKHPKFEEEQEWRIVYRVDQTASGAEQTPRLFRARGNIIVPYIELALKSSFERYRSRLPIFSVMIGPSVHLDLVTKSVVMLLQDHDYADPNVLSSEVPLRT